MASQDNFRMKPPQQVFDAYKEIRDSELVRNCVLTDETIASFQNSLNKAQPRSEDEAKMRSAVQFFYRRNIIKT